MHDYVANPNRYEKMVYNRVGKSGLKLPAVSLGLWQNFGFMDSIDNIEKMIYTAFDNGITHFDLANNYGYPYNGSSEENFRTVLSRGLGKYRHELCISTKAGYEMWDGPYGDKNGSRKYLITSLEQSLIRMGLDYVDIFYHHVYDPMTPLEETAVALDDIVRQGKAIYVGISNYNSENTAKILEIFRELKTPFVVNQPSYSMLNRWVEDDGLDELALKEGFGLAAFSPLYRGVLTNKYLDHPEMVAQLNPGNKDDKQKLAAIEKAKQLDKIAKERGQSLSQMALSWVISNPAVCTVLIGASRPEQIVENLKAVENIEFSAEEMELIGSIC